MTDASQMAEIARRVHTARTTRGWSQIELAARAGVSRPTVARVEGGEDVNTAKLTVICAALGLQIELTERIHDRGA